MRAHTQRFTIMMLSYALPDRLLRSTEHKHSIPGSTDRDKPAEKLTTEVQKPSEQKCANYSTSIELPNTTLSSLPPPPSMTMPIET